MASRWFRFARGMDRRLLPFMGPAQVGAGHPEEPYRLPDRPLCPVCGAAMSDHDVQRSSNPSVPTRLRCPGR